MQVLSRRAGGIRTTQAFLTHLGERGRRRFGTPPGGALEGWSERMAFELSKLGIAIKMVSPGGIKTDFQGRSLALAHHPGTSAGIAPASRSRPCGRPGIVAAS